MVPSLYPAARVARTDASVQWQSRSPLETVRRPCSRPALWVRSSGHGCLFGLCWSVRRRPEREV